MTLPLRLLNAADLAADWMTLYVGWKGFETGHWLEPVASLPTKDVQKYAYDAFVKGIGAPWDDAVFRLWDADSGNVREIERTLSELAEGTDISRDVAVRKWRLAAVHAARKRCMAESVEDERIAQVEALFNLARVWNVVADAHPVPPVMYDWSPEGIQEAHRLLRAWCDAERDLLTRP